MMEVKSLTSTHAWSLVTGYHKPSRLRDTRLIETSSSAQRDAIQGRVMPVTLLTPVRHAIRAIYC